MHGDVYPNKDVIGMPLPIRTLTRLIDNVPAFLSPLSLPCTPGQKHHLPLEEQKEVRGYHDWCMVIQALSGG